MAEDTWQEFRDEIADALTDAYCGGASGRGWTIWGDPIPKEEVKARLVQDPDKTRHIAHMENAVWAVIERWCETGPPPSREQEASAVPLALSIECTLCAGTGAQLCECDKGERPIQNCFSCSGRECVACGGSGEFRGQEATE